MVTCTPAVKSSSNENPIHAVAVLGRVERVCVCVLSMRHLPGMFYGEHINEFGDFNILDGYEPDSFSPPRRESDNESESSNTCA